MSKKSLLIWILFLLTIAVLKTSASGTNNEINEGTDLDENDDATQEEEEEAHAQRQDYSFSLSEFLSQRALPEPPILLANIIGGAFDELTDGMLLSLPPDFIFELLCNPLGAHLAASRPFEIFTESNYNALIIDLIHDNFFINLDLFSDKVSSESLPRIPASFIIKTIEIRSRARNFNLNRFIAKFENYDQSLSFEISKVLCLPHLFDFPRMINSEFFMGRGISFDSSLLKRDLIIWDISLQLFLFRLLNEEAFKVSLDAYEVLRNIKQEISLSRKLIGLDIDFNMNYFGIKNAINFNVLDEFVTSKVFTLEERSICIDELSSSLGLPSFISIDYNSLDVENRIVYRLIIYLIIFNPSLLSEEARNSLIINFFSCAPSNDFTEAEIDFLANACIDHELAEVIVTIFKNSMFSKLLRTIESKLTRSVQAYNSVVGCITNEVDKLVFLKRGSVFFTNGIKFNDEEFYRQKQANCRDENGASVSLINVEDEIEVEVEVEVFGSPLVRTKRLRNGDHVPESNFSSHFLTMEQLQIFGPLRSTEDDIDFVAPYPNKDYFNARYDNLMQNLDSADLGEIKWKETLLRLDSNVKKAYEQYEKDLDEFVRVVFQAIDCERNLPRVDVSILFRGSPSHGDGIKMEALETFSRAILLPRFKVFYYNSDLNGFIPYPLLHHEIMASLGYLNKFFLSHDLPLSWNLSADYLKFLFYEEDPFESMQNVIESFYASIFKTIDGLKSPEINPLDYFTTTFHAHQPLAFHDQTLTETSPLDLLSPIEATEKPSRYITLNNYLDADTIKFLDEPVYHSFSYFEECKGESKDDFKGRDLMEAQNSSENSYFRKLELNTELLEAIKQAVSHEIIQILLLGRFAFIKNFLPFFNAHSHNHITSNFYNSLQMAQAKEITADILISGLNFGVDEKSYIEVFDAEGNVYNPRETLEYILRTLPQKLMKNFYWFCTGCLSLPLGDLRSNPIGVTITRNPLLPAARTCFRSLTFNLNPALNLEGHIEAMRMALTESSGFHVNEGISIQNQIVGVFVDIPVDNSGQMEIIVPVADESSEPVEPLVPVLDAHNQPEANDLHD